MRGMESQESWPVSAAISAFTVLLWSLDCGGGTSMWPAGPRNALSDQHATWCCFKSGAMLIFLYLSIAVLGVGVEGVISLPTGARLTGQHAWILTGAAFVLMGTISLIGLTSKRREADPPAWSRFLLLLTLLPAPWLSRVAPSCVLVVQVLLLCAVQIGLGRALAFRSRRPKNQTHDCPDVRGRF